MAIESLPTFTKPARQRWESIPADIRQRLLYDAFPRAKVETARGQIAPDQVAQYNRLLGY